MDEKIEVEANKAKKPSKKAVEKIEAAIDNIKVADGDTVKKAVKKAAKMVSNAAEKVEHELKNGKNEIVDKKKKNSGHSKKLSHSVVLRKKLFIEYGDKQINEELIYDKLIHTLKDMNFKEDIKTLDIYYKVEETTAYCVINHGEPIVLRIFD